LLGFRGIAKRVLSRGSRKKLRASGPITGEPTGVWANWAKIVEKRPKLLALAAVVIMGVLLIPTFSVPLRPSDHAHHPSTSSARKAYDLLAEGFGPGFNGPLLVVAQLGSSGDASAVTKLANEIRTQPDVVAVIPSPITDGAKIATITVMPNSSPESEQTT